MLDNRQLKDFLEPICKENRPLLVYTLNYEVKFDDYIRLTGLVETVTKYKVSKFNFTNGKTVLTLERKDGTNNK